MKITIEPETEREKQQTEPRVFTGLRSVAVIGIAYEGDVLRRPCPYSYGDLRDLMREFPVMALDMAFAIIAADGAADRENPDRHDCASATEATRELPASTDDAIDPDDCGPSRHY